jgi:hypothetical protein
MEKIAGILRVFAFLGLLLTSVAFAQNATPPEGYVSEADVAAELAIRDSVMTACNVESDSLRNIIESEQAKSANWEKSYNTVKQDNSVCQQALRVAIDAGSNNGTAKREAAMMTGSSFLGGIALGMLLFWLIFD